MSKKRDREYSSFSTMEKVYSAETLLHEIQSQADRHDERMAWFRRVDNLRMRVKESRAGSIEHRIYILSLKVIENRLAYGAWVELKVGALFVVRCLWSMLGIGFWMLARTILVIFGYCAAAGLGLWLLYLIFLS